MSQKDQTKLVLVKVILYIIYIIVYITAIAYTIYKKR